MELRSNGIAPPTPPHLPDKPQPAVHPAQPTNASAIDKAHSAISDNPSMPAAGLDEALRSINDSMRSMSQSLEFSVDPETDRTVVKVIDQQTKEVIRQMPSVEALEIAKALDRLQGLLIRQQA